MPTRILSPCAEPRCPDAGTDSGRCPRHAAAHRRLLDTPLRRSERAFYASPDWRALRYAVLLRDPICKLCDRARSTQADHKTPRSQGGADTMENLQGACWSCHSRKTANENRGISGRWGGRTVTRLQLLIFAAVYAFVVGFAIVRIG